jgi:BTB/POZ domain
MCCSLGATRSDAVHADSSGKIGERLYRVHKYFLVHESAFFRDMIALPQGGPGADGAAPVERQSEEHPIMLADTTELEFDSILEFLYFRCATYPRAKYTSVEDDDNIFWTTV